MKLRLPIQVALIGFSFSLIATSEVKAASFTFTKIADSSGIFDDFAEEAINNNSEVAFFSSYDVNQGQGIFTGNGGQIKTIADTNGTNGSFYDLYTPSINDAGTVVFEDDPNSNTSIIYSSSDQGNIIPIQYNSIIYYGAINNKGQTVYRKDLDPTGKVNGIVVSTPGQNDIQIANNINLFSFLDYPVINDAGIVAFGGSFKGENSQGIFKGNGGLLTDIASRYSNPYLDILNVLSIAINNQGTVGFIADTGFGTQQKRGIYTGSGGALTLIADETFYDFSNSELSINDSGIVAFDAKLKSGGYGIFTGHNPVKDKVIATGDSLFGSTVKEVYFYTGGLNDKGQIAFDAVLADDTSVVVRANPKPQRQFIPHSCQNFRCLFNEISTNSLFTAPISNAFHPNTFEPFSLHYQTDSDSLFTEISDLPTGFDGVFTISALGRTLGQFRAGDSVDFVSLLGTGVSDFDISDIKPSTDATEPNSFSLQLAFNTEIASFQTQVKTVPEPNFNAAFWVVFGALAKLGKRKQQVIKDD